MLAYGQAFGAGREAVKTISSTLLQFYPSKVNISQSFHFTNFTYISASIPADMYCSQIK